MILTERQKNILSLFLINQEVSIKEIEDHINISRRTIYREFKNLRSLLADDQLELASKRKKYFLRGDEHSLQHLKHLLQKTKSQTILTVEQREHALIFLLLFNAEPQKIINLALDLNVSEATIQNDLDNVEKKLLNYQINLIRKPGIGILVKTNENNRRQILIRILLNEINDYSFFNYINQIQDQSNDFFLSLLSRHILLETSQELQQIIFPNINLDSDHQIIELILSFTISILRMQHGHFIEQGTLKKKIPLNYQGLVLRFMAKINHKLDLQVKGSDVNYLASKVMRCDIKKAKLYYDNDIEIAISIKVKKFIQLLSKKFNWNFQKDPNFVNRVNKHILNLLQHNVTPLPDTRIETLFNLSNHFSKLYNAIKITWNAIFPKAKLTTSEMELLLLYFANEYANMKNNHQFDVLVICENGIGTAAILRSRLKQELPEIKNIDISKVTDLPKINLKEYDLILSTLELQGFSRKYQLVSPLLFDDEIKRIKNNLKKYEHNFPIHSEPQNSSYDLHATSNLKEVSLETHFCEKIINGIKVRRLKDNTTDLVAIVQKCLTYAEEITDKPLFVAQKIIERLKLAPVGIPDSQIALFHTSNKKIKCCRLMIFELDNTIPLLAMDQIEIKVKRILIMLGPEKLTKAEQNIMSMISSMIIMDDANLQLFTTGNQVQIQNAISAQYLHELNKKLSFK